MQIVGESFDGLLSVKYIKNQKRGLNMYCPRCNELMVKNGKGRRGEQRWLCKSCSSTKNDAVELVSVDAELAVAAQEQGLDITKLTNDAIALQIDFDSLPYSNASYREAIAVLKQHNLEFHYPLARSIAKAIDRACKQTIQEY